MLVMDAIAADPQARGHLDPLLLPDHPDHRGRGRGWAASHHLPPGARRRRHGERFCPHRQRPAAGGLRHAVRTWRGERLSRASRPPIRTSAPVLLLPLGHPRDTAQLFPMFKSTRTYRVGHQVGRGADAAGPGRPSDAPRLQPAEERPARPGHGRSAGRCGEGRPRHRHDRLRAGPRGAIGRRSARRRTRPPSCCSRPRRR